MPDHQVLDHNRATATVWGAGGRGYDDVSFAIADALGHAAQRLASTAGERVLDVATGTGWSARNVARTGAQVTAVDIAPELLEAAQELSALCKPPIDFRLADAEALPFGEGQFDKVISTFGVMFAGDQARAARELGRVCRKDGRLCLATW
ncbi:MAG: class I SAM-dependent methyltransferase, partial [Solimonas sp.]